MFKNLAYAFLFAASFTLPAAAFTQPAPAITQPPGAPAMPAACRVLDPTGTPLNIRTAPDGHIVGTFDNGDPVLMLDRAPDRNGKTWVYVGSYPGAKPIGWVYRDYIDCTDGGLTSHADGSPSFNCHYAKTPDEVLICQRQDLADADVTLSTFFFQLRNQMSPSMKRWLDIDEARWLNARRDCGYDAVCVEKAYDDRMAELSRRFCRNDSYDCTM